MRARMLRRLPFTLLLVLGVVATGLLTGAPWSSVDPAVLTHWGFALHDLPEGRWYTLVTGVVLTRHPIMFWGILLFAFASVGSLEWRAGPRRAVARYWQTELIGTVGGALVVAALLVLSGSPLAVSFPRSGEVGMSAGGFGCLGATVAHLSPRRRAAVFWSIAAYLVVRLVCFTQLSGDTIHLITFPLGFWLESRTARRVGTPGARLRA